MTGEPSKTPASSPRWPRSPTPRPKPWSRWIKKNLFAGGKLRDDERLIVFTEYKETLFFLEQRLLQEGFDKNTLRLLYGGMSADEFEAVKCEFEDPTAAVRLLLATDAASEGINMQECAAGSSITTSRGRRRSCSNATVVCPATGRSGTSASTISAATKKRT